MATPSMDQWIAHLQELEPIHGDPLSGAALVAAGRDEDDQVVGG